MDSLISKLQKRKATLSNLENQVLEYILANPEEVSESTVEQVAEKLYISTATISRTAKHLGFKGFQELKYAILNYSNAERGESNPSRLAKNASVFGQNIARQIEKSFEFLSENQVDEIVTMLSNANTIEIVGVGGSLPACVDASKKLMALGKKATARTDWDELRAISKSLNENDLAILISLSGETIHIIEYAQNYLEKKVPIIAVVGVPDSSLEKLATQTLKAFVEPVYFQDVDLSSRAALTSILDFILIKMVEKEV